MEVVILKMQNGAELIGEFQRHDHASDGSKVLVMDRVRQVITDGNTGGLIPYLMLNPDANGVEIRESKIEAGPMVAPADVAREYLQSVTKMILAS